MGVHEELAAFLRSRRERISPASVGLPTGSRRRTPGLRREEVAQLAGVGVTWYTWLEQGRDIHVSAQVLGAIASTLRLDPSERRHLFKLAEVLDPSEPPAEAPVARPVLATIEALRPLPAYVVNGRWDLLAYNPEMAHLFGGFDGVPPERLNIMWMVFVYGMLGKRVVNLEAEAARHVALFRTSMADHTDDPVWIQLRDDLLAASEQFREYWDRYEVAAATSRQKGFRFGDRELRMEVASMWLTDHPHARLVVYTPTTDEDRAALDLLSQPDQAVWTRS